MNRHSHHSGRRNMHRSFAQQRTNRVQRQRKEARRGRRKQVRAMHQRERRR